MGDIFRPFTRFKLGDVVTWENPVSRSIKVGAVTEVVRAWHPTTVGLPAMHGRPTTMAVPRTSPRRGHESYVVDVIENGVTRRYWPRVCGLRRAAEGRERAVAEIESRREKAG